MSACDYSDWLTTSESKWRQLAKGSISHLKPIPRVMMSDKTQEGGRGDQKEEEEKRDSKGMREKKIVGDERKEGWEGGMEEVSD